MTKLCNCLDNSADESDIAVDEKEGNADIIYCPKMIEIYTIWEV